MLYNSASAMRAVACLLVLIGCTVGYAEQDTVDFSRYRLVRASPDNTKQLTVLASYLHKKSAQGDVDVWKFPRDVKHDVTFSLHSHVLRDVSNWLHRRNIRYRVDRRDLKSMASAAADSDAASLRQRSRVTGLGLDLDVYNNHDDMNEYLRQAAADCEVCTVLNIGTSHEGRPMNAIKIGRFGRNKTAIWIDAGIHAREWIAPATALKIVNFFVVGIASGDREVRWMLANFVWYILPSANPDGYMYSREHNRFWRKTRKAIRNTSCVGADPNRNWAFHWAEAGTSSDPCSEIYTGTRPFSEVETRNMRDFLYARKHLIQAYISLHSYGQYWMYPWGFDSSLPENADDLDAVGRSASDAIMGVYDKRYIVGSSTNVLYAAAGASDDWAKGVAGIEYSYTVELRDSGDHGFLLPANQIQPTGQEMWAGLVAMAKSIRARS